MAQERRKWSMVSGTAGTVRGGDFMGRTTWGCRDCGAQLDLVNPERPPARCPTCGNADLTPGNLVYYLLVATGAVMAPVASPPAGAVSFEAAVLAICDMMDVSAMPDPDRRLDPKAEALRLAGVELKHGSQTEPSDLAPAMYVRASELVPEAAALGQPIFWAFDDRSLPEGYDLVECDCMHDWAVPPGRGAAAPRCVGCRGPVFSTSPGELDQDLFG